MGPASTPSVTKISFSRSPGRGDDTGDAGRRLIGGGSGAAGGPGLWWAPVGVQLEEVEDQGLESHR